MKMVSLRDVDAADRERIRAWRNLPEVRANMFTDHEISEDEHARWFAGLHDDPRRRYWVVCCDGRDVGLAHLYDIDRHHGRCSWGYYLASPSDRGRGIGSVVWYLLLRCAFDELGLRKVYGEVLAVNASVLRMHERFGFLREGFLRHHVVKGGVPHDVVVFGLLADDWRAIRPDIERMLRGRNLL